MSEYLEEDGCHTATFIKRFNTNNLEINCSNIHQLQPHNNNNHQQLIGSGAFNNVYLSKFNGRNVAVKIGDDSLLQYRGDTRYHLRTEPAVLYQLRHASHIVQMIGYCNLTLVMEYLPGGTLEDLVLDTTRELSVQMALEYALDAAMAVMQLHEVDGGPVAHRDIDLCQFLIDSDGRLKLNDFNRLSYTGPRLYPNASDDDKCMFTTRAVGKIRSPEELSSVEGVEDEKVDIYGLGIVFWELRSRVPPFEELEDDEEAYVLNIVVVGERPPLESMADYPQEMQDLVEECWDEDPDERPPAREVVERLKKILRDYKESNKKTVSNIRL